LLIIIKRLKERVDPSKVDAFQKGMQKWATDVMKSFDNWRFYIGEKMDPEAMVILQGYRADEVTPYFIFFKDGLEEEKF